jgi:hypothetical protein
MSSSPNGPKGSRPPDLPERRGTAGGSLQKMRGLLARPLAVERRAGQLQVVLVERRAAAPTAQALREALRERLPAQRHRDAARVMRHLVAVHDALGRKGWASVEALPARVLGKALMQAEMLADAEASPVLDLIVQRLRVCQLAAEAREQRLASAQDTEPAVLITEASHEEFEAMARSWVGELPRPPRPSGGAD